MKTIRRRKRAADRTVLQLLDGSQWFQVEPMPNGFYLITVEDDCPDHLLRQPARINRTRQLERCLEAVHDMVVSASEELIRSGHDDDSTLIAITNRINRTLT